MQITERLHRESGRDYALRVIRDNIVSLDLLPGSQISENELAAELGLSRTPVREALIELSRVRIVDIRPQKRGTVARIDCGLVEEAWFMRHALECAVLVPACENWSETDLRRLSENVKLQRFYLENDMLSRLMELDNDFHRTLFEIARKPQSYEMIRTISIHLDRVRRLSLEAAEDLKIVDDHGAILKAVRDRNSEEARRLMTLHLDRCRVDAQVIRARYSQYFSE